MRPRYEFDASGLDRRGKGLRYASSIPIAVSPKALCLSMDGRPLPFHFRSLVMVEAIDAFGLSAAPLQRFDSGLARRGDRHVLYAADEPGNQAAKKSTDDDHHLEHQPRGDGPNCAYAKRS